VGWLCHLGNHRLFNFVLVVLVVVAGALVVPGLVVADHTVGVASARDLVTADGATANPWTGRYLALAVTTVAPDIGDVARRLTGTTPTRPPLGPDDVHRFVRVADRTSDADRWGARSDHERAVDDAWAAATTVMGRADHDVILDVVRVDDHSPAARAGLSAGDRIVAIDGAPVDIRRLDGTDRALTVVTSHQGLTSERTVELGVGDDGTYGLHVRVHALLDGPAPALTTLTDSRGPSAGLINGIAFVDSLTAADLTAGRTVAATGTITPDGTVGAVGHIHHKVTAAVAAGAQLIFVPRDAVTEADRALALTTGPGPRPTVVGVTHLFDAVVVLCATADIHPCLPGVVPRSEAHRG
jgi:PDZ domain-containing protein